MTPYRTDRWPRVIMITALVGLVLAGLEEAAGVAVVAIAVYVVVGWFWMKGGKG